MGYLPWIWIFLCYETLWGQNPCLRLLSVLLTPVDSWSDSDPPPSPDKPLLGKPPSVMLLITVAWSIWSSKMNSPAGDMTAAIIFVIRASVCAAHCHGDSWLILLKNSPSDLLSGCEELLSTSFPDGHFQKNIQPQSPSSNVEGMCSFLPSSGARLEQPWHTPKSTWQGCQDNRPWFAEPLIGLHLGLEVLAMRLSRCCARQPITGALAEKDDIIGKLGHMQWV